MTGRLASLRARAALATPRDVGTLAWTVALLLFAIVVVRTAWMADDAYITQRTIRNFVHGDGLRWNLDERVQSFSHPLWLFLLAGFHWLTDEYHLTVLAVSLAVSLTAAVLISRGLHHTATARVLALLVLCSSRSFVDYSTSGLENPLTHLLLAVLLLVYLGDRQDRRAAFALSLAASLCAVNRPDTVLLTVPVVAAAWLRDRDWRALPIVALGWLPLVAWEVFSVVYYGFPFPNSAYAKVPWWASAWDVARHGLIYLSTSIRFDWLAASVLAAGLVLPLATGRRHLVPLSIGIALYLAYLLKIGGDFMAGRFFTAPLVFAVTAAIHCLPALPIQRALIPAVVALGLAAGAKSSLVSGPRYGARPDKTIVNRHGISDERAYYYPSTGLLRDGRAFEPPSHDWGTAAAKLAPGSVSVQGGGFRGLFAPRDVYLVDFLTDALLARLPPRDARKRTWRPGHQLRAIPRGYVSTRQTGQNKVEDPNLAAYLDELDRVIRGPLWSADRFRAIWALNTGALDHLLPR